jgi:hypothetical protein
VAVIAMRARVESATIDAFFIVLLTGSSYIMCFHCMPHLQECRSSECPGVLSQW